MNTDRKILRGPLEAGTTVSRQWSTEGYVEVPREMLRQAGLNHGNAVKLEPLESGEAVIKSIEQPGPAHAVVHYGRMCLRFWRGAIRRAGLDAEADKVEFTFDGTGILVRT